MDTEGVHVAKPARLSFCGIFWVIFVHIMHDCKPSTLDADVKAPEGLTRAVASCGRQQAACHNEACYGL